MSYAHSSLTQLEDDKHSVASTRGSTTASLSQRIASLAVDLNERAQLYPTQSADFVTLDQLAEVEEDEEAAAGAKAEEGAEGAEEEEEEEEEIQITEEQLLRELDGIEPAFLVCSRLFKEPVRRGSVLWQRLSWDKAEEFRHRGFAVLDNFLSKEHVARARHEALAAYSQGHFVAAARGSDDGEDSHIQYTDPSARGDHIMWLEADSPPPDSPGLTAALLALKELREDLARVLRLRAPRPECQLAVYGAGGQYVRHRDAFPDDGSEAQQRRVTVVLFANPNWVPSDGGKLRLWPPARGVAPLGATPSSHAGSGGQRGPPGGAHSHAHEQQGPGSRATSARHLDYGARHGSAGLANGLANGHAGPHSAGQALSVDGSEPEAHHAPPGHPGPPPLSEYGSYAEPASDTASQRSEDPAHTLASYPSGHSGHATGYANGYSHHVSWMPVAPGPGRPRGLSTASIASSALEGAPEPSVLDSACDGSSVEDGSTCDGHSSRPAARGTEVPGPERTEVGPEPILDLAPLGGRAVIFLSGAVEHAVLPTSTTRVALTAWCQ